MTRPTPKPDRDDRRDVAELGEEIVARHFADAGFIVEARNHRVAGVEVDLIVRDARFAFVVEVKTTRRALPETQLKHEQMQRLRRAANTLAIAHPSWRWAILLAALRLEGPYNGQELRFFRLSSDGFE